MNVVEAIRHVRKSLENGLGFSFSLRTNRAQEGPRVARRWLAGILHIGKSVGGLKLTIEAATSVGKLERMGRERVSPSGCCVKQAEKVVSGRTELNWRDWCSRC